MQIHFIFDSKNPLGRGGHRWEDNIKLDLKEIRYGLIQLSQVVDKQQSLVNMVLTLAV
jgi:hypothetical protein